MNLRAWIIASALLAAAGGAIAEPAAEGDVQAFRRLRAEAVEAINAGDYAAAEAKLAEADRRVPNHPGLTVLRAKVDAAQDDMAGAVAMMDRYAGFGLTIDVAADEVLQRVSIENEFAPVGRRLMANDAPIGKLEIVGQIEGAYLAEGVVWDARRKRWLISGVHGRTIVAVDRGDRRLSRYLAADASVDSVMGMTLDAEAGVLWAATSGMPQAKDLPADHRGRGGVLKIDLRSGRVLQRYDAPPAADRAFGDIVRGPDGTIYVADAVVGEIWRLAPGGSALELLAPAGRLGSPQGMAVTPDGRRMIVADYSSGLRVVDLATGAVSALPVPDDASLLGVDGLIRHGDALIAVQNGVTPQRVVRLELDPDFTRVTRWRAIAANLPELAEPTNGVVVDGELVLIARSQWTDFKLDGGLRVDPPGPAILARLKLD